MLTGAYGGAVNYINYGITVIPCHGITVIPVSVQWLCTWSTIHNHWIVDCGLCPWTMGTITGRRLWYGVNHNNYNHWTSPKIYWENHVPLVHPRATHGPVGPNKKCWLSKKSKVMGCRSSTWPRLWTEPNCRLLLIAYTSCLIVIILYQCISISSLKISGRTD